MYGARASWNGIVEPQFTLHRSVASTCRAIDLPMTTDVLLEWVIKSAIILFVLVTAVAYLTFLERKVMSWIQLRIGPNRVGPWGLLQPLADGIKMIFKEDIIPTEANRWLYVIAPAISLVPALMTFIVIPYGSFVHVPGIARPIALRVTTMNVGLLYI